MTTNEISLLCLGLIFGAVAGISLGWNLGAGAYRSRALKAILLILTNLAPAERVTLISRIREQNEPEKRSLQKTN